jgi:hypothetical protein
MNYENMSEEQIKSLIFNLEIEKKIFNTVLEYKDQKISKTELLDFLKQKEILSYIENSGPYRHHREINRILKTNRIIDKILFSSIFWFCYEDIIIKISEEQLNEFKNGTRNYIFVDKLPITLNQVYIMLNDEIIGYFLPFEYKNLPSPDAIKKIKEFCPIIDGDEEKIASKLNVGLMLLDYEILFIDKGLFMPKLKKHFNLNDFYDSFELKNNLKLSYFLHFET